MNSLNPFAKIIESSFSKINLKEILNARSFDFEQADRSAEWVEELTTSKHTPEPEEHGIYYFIFRTKKLFHSESFWNYIQLQFLQNILRHI